MQTEDLIRTLSHDAKLPNKPAPLRTLLVFVGLALAICVALILLTEGVRPDFESAIAFVGMKAGLSALFALCALPLALRLGRPGRKSGIWAAVAFGMFVVAAAMAAMAIGKAAPQERVQAITGGGFPHNLIIIPILAIPAGVVIFAWLRRQAPTRLMLAGSTAGLIAGSLSAMAYALVCPVDSMAFVAIWYGLAIAVCAFVGAIVGRWALRW
jgi:hypothetical protein